MFTHSIISLSRVTEPHSPSTLGSITNYVNAEMCCFVLSKSWLQSCLPSGPRLILQIILLAIFLHFFGLPAVEKYLKQDVMIVETRKDTDGIPLPAITISGVVNQEVPCFSQNLSIGCIEANTQNLSEILNGVLLGYGKKEAIILDQNYVSEDFTSVWAGRQYTLKIPLKIGPDYLEDQFFLLLPPNTVRIYLHDPDFFIFNQNPAGPPTKRMHVDGKKNKRKLFRTLGLTEMNELNVPADPCNDDQSYNFNSCVRTRIAKQVGC